MRLQIISKGKTLSIIDGLNNIKISEISARLGYEGDFYNTEYIMPSDEWHAKTTGNTCVFTNGDFRIKSICTEDTVLLQTSFTNKSSRPIKSITTIDCFIGKWEGTPDSIVRSDAALWPSWHHFDIHRSMVSTVDTIKILNDQSVSGEDFIAVKGKECNLVTGFVTLSCQFNKLNITGEGKLSAACLLEGKSLEPSETITSEMLMLKFPQDPVEGLCDYAKNVKTLSNVKEMKDVPIGWCSWYYYLDKVENIDVYENMQYLSENKNNIPVRTLQIDAGWEKSYGDWEPNEKFPNGMKTVADNIREKGFIPGLWLAPFAVSDRSSIIKEHSDWLVKNSDGNPVKSPEAQLPYGLDTTHPEVKIWLEQLFRKVTVEWGFKYLKLDFLTNAIMPGIRYESNITTAQAFREGMEIIRNTVGNDVFILNCTSAFGPSVGIADAMRIGPDIMGHWESLKGIANRVLKNYFMHGNFFINDADCLIIRDSESEDESCMRKCTFTKGEIITYLTMMAASGGIIMLSDKMTILKNEQQKLIEKILPATNKAAMPLDLFESNNPGLLYFGSFSNIGVYSFTNWGDYSKPMCISANDIKISGSDYHVYDFWNNSYLGLYNKGSDLKFIVEAHKSKVIFVTENISIPHIVGSNIHISGGIETYIYNKDTEELIVKLSRVPSFKAYVYVFSDRSINYIEGGSIVESENGLVKVLVNDINLKIKYE